MSPRGITEISDCGWSGRKRKKTTPEDSRSLKNPGEGGSAMTPDSQGWAAYVAWLWELELSLSLSLIKFKLLQTKGITQIYQCVYKRWTICYATPASCMSSNVHPLSLYSPPIISRRNRRQLTDFFETRRTNKSGDITIAKSISVFICKLLSARFPRKWWTSRTRLLILKTIFINVYSPASLRDLGVLSNKAEYTKSSDMIR